MKKLAIKEIKDDYARDNFQILQDFMDGLSLTPDRFRVLELFLTENVTQLRIRHGLGFIPLDVLPTRLVAPSGAKLTFLYSEFTKDEIAVTVTGLSGVLSTRLLVGTFPNVQTTNTREREANETQEWKSKV